MKHIVSEEVHLKWGWGLLQVKRVVMMMSVCVYCTSIQIIVLSRVIVDADSVELTAHGVTTLVKILSSINDSAVVHAGKSHFALLRCTDVSIRLSKCVQWRRVVSAQDLQIRILKTAVIHIQRRNQSSARGRFAVDCGRRG